VRSPSALAHILLISSTTIKIYYKYIENDQRRDQQGKGKGKEGDLEALAIVDGEGE